MLFTVMREDLEWKLLWDKVWQERDCVPARGAAARPRNFSGWEKKQKPRDAGGGAGEKEGRRCGRMWRPGSQVKKKTWKTREQPPAWCSKGNTCTDPRLHKGPGVVVAACEERAQEETRVEPDAGEQGFHSNRVLFVSFLNKGTAGTSRGTSGRGGVKGRRGLGAGPC